MNKRRVVFSGPPRDGESPPRVRGLVHFKAAGTLRRLAAESGYRVKEFRRLLAARPRKRKSPRRKKTGNNQKGE